MEETFNRGDLRGVRSFHRDANLMGPAEVTSGRDNIDR